MSHQHIGTSIPQRHRKEIRPSSNPVPRYNTMPPHQLSLKNCVGRFRFSKPPINAQYPIQSNIKNPRLENPSEDQLRPSQSNHGGLLARIRLTALPDRGMLPHSKRFVDIKYGCLARTL